MKKLLLLAAFALSAAATFAKDIRTVVLTTQPQMHCHNCENKVTENLRYVKGVKSIKASAANQTITVVIDAEKCNPEALVKSLKKAGYTATVKSNTPAERADKPVQPKPKAEKAGVKAEKAVANDSQRRQKVDAQTAATAVQQ